MVPPCFPTVGRELFLEWLSADATRTKRRVAAALGVSSAAVGHWAGGRAVPGHPYRPALRVLCGITEDAWVTDEERTRSQAALDGAVRAVGELAVVAAARELAGREPDKPAA